MKALLSIKPEFVEKILSGEKLVEYRKAVFKRPEVKSVVIYSTMPDGLIVGEFEIGQILAKPPEELWEQTKDVSGINKQFFDEYFTDRDVAYAIEIKKLKRYATPINPYEKEEGFKAPQSFKYIEPSSELCIN
ncbi:ASCH domain-containing protein [Vibrio antiquarius]|uniref:ASCH domain-containing protein n=1 Tax=Vibrio TaxID=662 RepID=UPI000426C1F3|nr:MULTISPECIES: ASCH domain-containing protein [Vibrio harveyi group]EGQ9817937.1 ASCH domain-containing protein [Vibrio parahaemolyticus]EGR2261176.1 ASCH domain-containing protein [Vibrio parahaemolyticus]EHK2849499.1 ASCH domain-containing protein [Vibrio parahaemolyticus]EIA1617229.1 ASCH domain-containing protein [Vibrio parahaemolyticus]EIZ1365211.1 ASCH domain-containing protein [Vibrio parahaemolyticus]